MGPYIRLSGNNKCKVGDSTTEPSLPFVYNPFIYLCKGTTDDYSGFLNNCYGLREMATYAIVDQQGKITKTFSVPELIQDCVSFASEEMPKTKTDPSFSTLNSVISNCTFANHHGDSSGISSIGQRTAIVSGGSNAAATCLNQQSVTQTTGTSSIASSTADNSAALSSGQFSIAASTGDFSASVGEGFEDIIACSGDSSLAAATGRNSIAVSGGWGSMASCSGERSVALAGGDHSSASVTGDGSIAIAANYESAARGSLGSWLILTEYYPEGQRKLIGVQAVQVDGERIKPNVYYKLEGGQIVEAKSLGDNDPTNYF